MKIKLSKSQWEFVGKKAGWMKKADNFTLEPGQGICVYDYSEKDDKYMTDCDIMVSPKFVDKLRASKDFFDKRHGTDKIFCPKCEKQIVTQGHEDDDERDMDENIR